MLRMKDPSIDYEEVQTTDETVMGLEENIKRIQDSKMYNEKLTKFTIDNALVSDDVMMESTPYYKIKVSVPFFVRFLTPSLPYILVNIRII